MADKICNLIENDDLRNEFSNKSYFDVEKFNLEDILKKWINIIND